jgi:hypothetical protein
MADAYEATKRVDQILPSFDVTKITLAYPPEDQSCFGHSIKDICNR